MNATQAHGIRAIVFDFGGVLVDWDPRYVFRGLFADEDAMERWFDEVEFAAWNLEQDRGRTFAEGVAEHSKKFPQHAALLQTYDERWIESIGGEIPGTVEILRALKQAGYPLYGLSNWAQEKFVLVRERYEFFDWFDGILISSEVKMAKPDPNIFALLLRQIGYAAHECLFIDDAQKNIETAEGLGFRAIRYESAEQLARALTERGIV
jgi:2-haloacid dehalogenase